ncbi:hypothetical protein [Soonwooa sp.]|uniref:hypothetical protein n=1 Tax=Soonwooa sp. TaxID=1938592 RepID=UPI0028AFC05F|nr:hypothetical protein [Soonwooa sp.]
MSNRFQNLETVPFADYMTRLNSKDFNQELDVDFSLVTDLHSYCTQLFEKLFSLKHSEIPDFLDYQCNHSKNAMLWLNKLEKLIEVNSELFIGARNESRKTKLYTCIEFKRTALKSDGLKQSQIRPNTKYINAQAEERYFSIKETRENVEKMQTDAEKILYLTKEIFEYESADIEMINHKLPVYSGECKKYITQIQTLASLKIQLEEETKKSKVQNQKMEKIRLYGPLNIMTNAFKQMMTDVKPSGLPYIQNKIKDIALFICNNFEDENGNSISKETVQTYLSPNRNDKDPNSDNSVKL